MPKGVYPRTEYHRRVIKECHKGMDGKVHSEETKRKIAEKLKGNTNGNYGKGIKRTPEQCKKIGESHKGQVPWNKGKTDYLSKEARERIGQASKNRSPPFLGKTHTAESKRKNGDKHLGDKAPNWKGGISFEPYCPKFTKEFKERVRAFFNHTCQCCGHVWQKGEPRLAVHHVNYDKMVCCNDVKPLFVPVCRDGCHGKTNYNRGYWEEVFTNKILLEYDGECYLPKGETCPV